MKVFSTKKLSHMSPEELLNKALISPAESEQVAQYLLAASSWEGALKVWEGLVSNPKTFSSKLVLQTFISYISNRPPDSSNLGLLEKFFSFDSSYLSSHSNEILSLDHLKNSPDYAAIAILGSGTPGDVVLSISREWGMYHGAPTSDESKRESLLSTMLDRMKSGTSFKNETMGALFGSLLAKNPSDPLVSAILDSTDEFPEEFVARVFEYGDINFQASVCDKADLDKKDIKTLMSYLRGSEDSAIQIKIVNVVIGSSSFSEIEKVEFCRLVRSFTSGSPTRDGVMMSLVRAASSSQQSEVYEFAIEELENGGYYSVSAITENIVMAMAHYHRIWNAVTGLGRGDEVSAGFKSFLGYFGEIEDETDGSYEDSWNLISNTWYERYRKS